MNTEDKPYALKTQDERQRRFKRLDEAHIAPLTRYVGQLRAGHLGRSIPFFDPCDGGVEAKVLFLMEAPGPKAVASGFISRNNPDPTAKNFCLLLEEAGVARRDSLLWNIVPWYVGDGTRIRAVNRQDLAEAKPYLADLLTLLPHLQYIALVGKKAQSAKPSLRELIDVPCVETHHPSAQVFNVWPHKRVELLEQLRELAGRL